MVSSENALYTLLLVELNRPKKRNAMGNKFWDEYRDVFVRLKDNMDVKAVVVSGAGVLFTAGLGMLRVTCHMYIIVRLALRYACIKYCTSCVFDMFMSRFPSLYYLRCDADAAEVFASLTPDKPDTARTSFALMGVIKRMQETFTCMERCPQPVIAAVHGGCVGAGVDLITACDIRVCSEDAWFSVKEVDVGLAADVGTLQRLPKVMGNQSLVRELALTARRMAAAEALTHGLVSHVLPTKDAAIAKAQEIAKAIAERSPVAVIGTKMVLNHSRDASVTDGLNFVSVWNASMLQTNDIGECMSATAEKRVPIFSKL